MTFRTQAPHVDGAWQLTRDGVGQGKASISTRTLAWLHVWADKARWAYQVLRALPQDGALVGADDGECARRLLLGVKNKLDDRSTTTTAAFHGVSDPTRTRAARKRAYSLIRWVWHVLKRIREQGKLGATLHSLSDRELADMGISRNEIEYQIGRHRREVEELVVFVQRF